MSIEPGIDAQRFRQAPQKQARSNQQRKRNRDLHDDTDSAETAGGGRRRRPLVLQRRKHLEPQEHRIDEGEHGHIPGDAERQRQDDHDGPRRTADQLAQRVPQVFAHALYL